MPFPKISSCRLCYVLPGHVLTARVQVGIYGYTAYSASKFGLRGLAEALQHEVVADSIDITLIFPPDTKTPGLAEGVEHCLMLFVYTLSDHSYHINSEEDMNV